VAGKKTTPKTRVAQRKPSHGNGMLNVGGTPGNKGNVNAIGAPRSEIRKASALAFAERIPRLAEIADGKGFTVIEKCPECGYEGEDVTPDDAPIPSIGEQVRAIDVLGKHGGISKESPIDPELVMALSLAVEAELPDIEGVPMGPVTERIYERWAVTLGRYAAGDA
jgi:hypothetical protein